MKVVWRLQSARILTAVVLLGATLVSYDTARSQPYRFSSYNGDGIFVVNRLNLRTNVTEEFLRDTTWDDWYVRADRTQRWVFLAGSRGPIVVVDANNPADRREIPLMENVEGYKDICSMPELNRFYVTWNLRFGEPLRTVVFNASTLAVLDSFPYEFSGICSTDGSTIYRWSEDTTSDESYIDAYSPATHALLRRKNESLIGPPLSGADKPAFGSANGYVLYGYQYPAGDTLNDKFQVYNLAADTTYPAIAFPGRSTGYLSGDGKYVIAEEVRLNPADSANAEYRPGSVSLYESRTARFVSHLDLPPDGEILLFPNHPDTLYYYVPAMSSVFQVKLP